MKVKYFLVSLTIDPPH